MGRMSGPSRIPARQGREEVKSPNVRDWRDGGRWLHTAAGKVFIRSGPGRAPTILLLHGYPSSSFDFRAVLPHLADHAWVTMDFLGFGLSDKPRPHRYSLLEQADLVQAVDAPAHDSPDAAATASDGTPPCGTGRNRSGSCGDSAIPWRRRTSWTDCVNCAQARPLSSWPGWATTRRSRIPRRTPRPRYRCSSNSLSPYNWQIDAGGMQPAAVDAHDRWSAGKDRKVARVGAGDGDTDLVPRSEQVRRRQQVESQLGDFARDEGLRVAAPERSVWDRLAVRWRRVAEPTIDGAELTLGDVGDMTARIDVFQIDKE